MNRLVIIVRGGCVVGVYSPAAGQPCAVEIIDVDNLRETSSREAIESEIKQACNGLESIY